MNENPDQQKGVQPLSDVFADLLDPRQNSGKRYPMPAILNLAVAAMLCGHDNPNQMAAYGQSLSPGFLKLLGFPRGQAPRKSALYELFSQLDVVAFEQRLGGWAEQVLAELSDEDETVAVALDGKKLRGSARQGAALSHLLSAVSHRLGITLHQVAVADKTNEIPLTPVLLANLLVKGRVFTMDALLTQRAIAQYIVDEGGDYFMVVKGNHPLLADDIALYMASFSP